MSDLIKCPTCKTKYASEPEKCPKCGYPFYGSDKEKTKFIAGLAIKRGHIRDAKRKIKKAQKILYIIGAFYIVFPLIKYMNTPGAEILIIAHIFVGGLFLIFGYLAKYQPLVMILIPLLLIIIFYSISFALNPLSIFKGLVFKIIIVGGLLFALVGVWKANKIRKESEFLQTKTYK